MIAPALRWAVVGVTIVLRRGKVVPTDDAVMAEIARLSGGEFFDAGSADEITAGTDGRR